MRSLAEKMNVESEKKLTDDEDDSRAPESQARPS